MKFLLLLLLFPLFTLAQNVADNVLFHVEYTGYSGGNYLYTVRSKQACDATIFVNWNSRSKDSTILLKKDSTLHLQLPGAFTDGSMIRIKTNDVCTKGGNSGWLGVKVSFLQALPLTVKSFAAKRKLFDVALSFDVEPDYDRLLLQRSLAGGAWQTIADVSFTSEYLDRRWPGQVLYRLQYVKSPSVEYSRVVSVTNTEAPQTVAVYRMNGIYLKTVTISDMADLRSQLQAVKGVLFLQTESGTLKWMNL